MKFRKSMTADNGMVMGRLKDRVFMFDFRIVMTIESRDSQVEYFPLGHDPV